MVVSPSPCCPSAVKAIAEKSIPVWAKSTPIDATKYEYMNVCDSGRVRWIKGSTIILVKMRCSGCCAKTIANLIQSNHDEARTRNKSSMMPALPSKNGRVRKSDKLARSPPKWAIRLFFDTTTERMLGGDAAAAAGHTRKHTRALTIVLS
jgi:hypothetical protein